MLAGHLCFAGRNEREDPRPTDATDPRKNNASFSYRHRRSRGERGSGIRRRPRHHSPENRTNPSGPVKRRRSRGCGNSQENQLPEEGSPRRKRRVGCALPQVLRGRDAPHGHRAPAEFLVTRRKNPENEAIRYLENCSKNDPTALPVSLGFGGTFRNLTQRSQRRATENTEGLPGK